MTNLRVPLSATLMLLLATAALAQSGPEPFTYIVRTGVATNAVITSEARTPTGYTGSLSVSVSGGRSSQYKIGSGTYTSDPGTITTGQSLTIRHTSAPSAETETVTTVTVGSYSTEFKSVTGTADRTPDAFDFGTLTNTELNTVVDSAPITLSGYNAGVSIVAGPGAQYSIDGGAFTSASGTLQVGQTLTARHTTSNQYLAYTKTYLKVGGITGYFTTRNRPAVINATPTISAIADAAIDEDGSTGPVAFTVGDAETAAGALTVSATSGNAGLVPQAGLALGGSGANRTITVTPEGGESGTAQITVTVSDGSSSASTTFTLTVNPVNDAPQAFDDGAITDEDTLVVVDVLANDVDGDSALDPASVTILSEAHGVATVNADTGAVGFLPDANFFGDAGFTYTVRDVEGAESGVATVAVFVNAINDAPVADDASFTIDEEGELNDTLTASDADGDALTFAKVSDPANGTLAVEPDGAFRYRPNDNFAGSDSFTFVANDGHGDSSPATVTITVNDQPEPVADPLAQAALDTAARGCDFLDPSNCLYPFPNDHFTVDAAPASPQSSEQGGTGRRVNFSIAAMPRNTAGKPVDPTEWNRHDGFSPGALITTYVPNLSLEKTFDRPAHEVGVANLALSQDPASPILVLEVDDSLFGAPQRHLVWAEIDQNANQLTIVGAPNVGTFEVPGVTNEHGHVSRPQNDGKAALLIRPAKNFAEGKRYVVVLRNLKDGAGNPIARQAGFAACVGGSALPPVQDRCAQLAQNVFPVLEDADIDLDDVYLAWDFTVQSTNNAIGRLRHMRDDAFGKLARFSNVDCTQLTDANAAVCASPTVEVTDVWQNPQTGIARRIEGTITVPSYLVPFEPAPGDEAAASSVIHEMCSNAGPLTEDCKGDFRDVVDTAQGATAPNRLFYQPGGAAASDPTNATDPTGKRYGDGLPDSTGSMQTRFLCQIPTQATPDNPARASLYGHGQLDKGVAITYEGVPEQTREHNYMFCAVDWFGFRTGDAVNVLSTLVDVSNFAVVPDASQQGMLNMMFLARAMKHPHGFGALPEFQDTTSGRPLFDRTEIFYDGNSQGGIFGGVVLAASKDVNRGVLGSLGMNYSTLLTRSANFDEYAGILYGAYTDPLDRQLLFSMIQMLWDRGENDGYASHLLDNRAFGGPANDVLLAPNFGDPQVTMWTADVMARTMGAVPADYRQTLHVETLGAQHRGANGRRHPDVVPYYGLPALEYTAAQTGGSALYIWDNAQRAGAYASIPPITNTPPYENSGKDPHDTSQRTAAGRCTLAHFMRIGGQVIDAKPLVFDGKACPQIPPAAPTVVPGAEPPPAPGFADALAAAFESWGTAMQAAVAQLAGGNPQGALGTAQGASGDLIADLYAGIAQGVGSAIGRDLQPPAPGAVNNPPPQPLLAGTAKRAIKVPVGVPLGGYLRPPVGGDYVPGVEPCADAAEKAFEEQDPAILVEGCVEGGQFIANEGFVDLIPAQADDGTPLATIPDEVRTVHSPYATYFPPSRGYYDSLVAKAVALYDGHDCVVLVKTDFIGMLDEVVQAVAENAESRLRAAGKLPAGCSVKQGLVMSATHTHDGPGALANHSTRYFWLAMDAYQPELFERLVPELADVVVDALQSLVPARFGHAIGQEADGAGTGRSVNSYRNGHENVVGVRAENDQVRRRIGVLRVDALDGTPLALVMNYAAHGIAFDIENMYFSGDVLAAAEREVEQGFATPVVAMLVQNTGGNVSPRADGAPKLQRIERFGKLLAPQVRAVYDGIGVFDAQPDLRAVSQRIVLSRDTIGYPDADGKNGDGDYPYPWGAAQCNGISGAPTTQAPIQCLVAPPPDPIDLADNGVAENGAFVPGDTILTAVKIGDAMLLAQPGEPLTEYGVRILKAAAQQGVDPAKTFIWGYSQDHVGYLLADDKTDWQRGQTEGTTTFWGWKLGDRLLKANVALMQSLRDGTPAPADEFQVNYFYKDLYALAQRPPVTPSARPGRIVTSPESIERFQQTAFAWEGGDPVLDLPDVALQQRNGTIWEPARRANGEPIDTLFEMHLKYRLRGAHQWTLELEPPKDWPNGTYRFVASGKALRAGEESYAVASAEFKVEPSPTLVFGTGEPKTVNGNCEATLSYTPRPANYRLIDHLISSDQPAPVRSGSVTFSNGFTDTAPEIRGTTAVYALPGACPAGVTATGADAWGNTTPGAGGPPPPDADGDGVPDETDECPGTPTGTPVNANGCPQEQFPVRFDELCAGPGCLSDLDVIGLQGALDTAWNTVFGGGTPPVVQDPIDPLVIDCTGPAGDPAPGTPGFAKRDADNIYCSMERHQDTMSQPANNPYMMENYGADPYRAPARHAGTRFRHADLNIAGVDGQAGTSFDRGQEFNAEIYMPCAAGTCTNMPAGLQTFEPPYPIAIVMHGAASDKKHLEWATQPLAERGYFVLTANGTGAGLPGVLLSWLFDPANPYADQLDLSRIGTAGHSLGAENATRVQGDSRVAGIVAFDPCDGSGGNECRDSEGSRLHDKGPLAQTPTLFLTADYLGFPGYPQPQVSVPGDLRVEGYGILRTNGVDTMLVTPRATTHLDWAGAFTFGNRLNEATSLYYTMSWFDRYVNGKLVVSGGNVATSHGRTEAQERAYRQAIADAAFAHLTASQFDGMVDLHNISQGRWDRLKAVQSGDLEYGGNVPYRVKGLTLADRFSFYHRSVCFVSRPNLMSGDGSLLLARADTTADGDMRETGCPITQSDPDRDGDGVPDAGDQCPDEAGPASNNGCPVIQPPDADGDGVPDDDDNCPGEAGPASNNGCPIVPPPDADGDGVPDEDDTCPNEAGPASNNGCPVVLPPDGDGDGVPDEDDDCPTEAGPASNNGCPEATGEGFPIRFEEFCDPSTFNAGCMDDIPGVTELQGVLDTVWNTAMGGGGEPPPPPPPASGESLFGCATAQDPAQCEAALSALAEQLPGCNFESLPDALAEAFGEQSEGPLLDYVGGPGNCGYESVHDAVGVGEAAVFLRSLFAECAASPGAAACGAIRSTADMTDVVSVPVLSRPIPRGDLAYTDVVPAEAPATRTVDGRVDDWMAQGTRTGGTDLYEFGEHVYTDFLFDSFGADDDDDARRWATLALLGEFSSRTERVDALQQAGNDQLDVPPPGGTSAGDHYGDAVNRDDGTDLTEVRWAADSNNLYLLARVARLLDASKLRVLILADTVDGASGTSGLNAGLQTAIFDRAVVLGVDEQRVVDLTTGADVTPDFTLSTIRADGYDNALEAMIPRSALERADGTLRVAVMTVRRNGDGSYTPANVAYRFDEPVTIFAERAQALSLFAGTVDSFVKQIAVADLTGGRTQTARPGFGYHERQFVSGANISNEADTENGRLQPYGVFVPHAFAVNTLNQARMTIWTHYRGGKAHSGASWTPRLFWQLGEEQGNLVVSPRGRGTSTWYTTRAHQDFFEVFADVAGTDVLRQYADENLPAGHPFTPQGRFFVDPARIYISGYSMGGFATYLFTGLYPDLFAGGFSQSGAVTQGAWTGPGPEPSGGCLNPALCFVEANSGRANAQLNYRILENTRHVPITIHHGTNDELALTPGAARMGARLAELRYRYDATTFLGYEHFTQAIIDEWRDGARYLNLHARPENPRGVTYKVVSALVKAVNEVQPQGSTGGFNFHPDGAYWVDDLVVRTGADGAIPAGGVVPFGQIDAESERVAALDHVAVPRSGTDVDSDDPAAFASDPYVSTPLYSPTNHSTPFVRHSLYWEELGPLAEANKFSAKLVNLSAATLDLARMGFTGHFDAPIDGSVTSDGDATLALANVGADVTACRGGDPVGSANAGGTAVVELPGGTVQAPATHAIRLVPLGAACDAAVEPPPTEPDPVSAALDAVEAIVAAVLGGNPQAVANAAVNGAAAVVGAAYAQSPATPSLPAPGTARMTSDCSEQSWIGGTTEICDGVLTYRDYVYDDHGADTQASYNVGYAVGNFEPPGGPLSPFAGDATYPAGQLNTADIVKLRLARNGDAIDIVAELNTLFPTSQTKLAVAVDADDDPETGTLPVLGLAARGVDVVHVFTTLDAMANTITGSFPLPAAPQWKVWAVVAQGNNTVMNVAFRGTEEEAKGLTSADAVGGTWWEDKQARALGAGDINGFGHKVATADLAPGVDRYDTIRPGLHERIYMSAYTLAPGEGISAGGIPGRGGNNNYPCEQLFHFLGKYQPYGLYIPHAYAPAQEASGLQLALHGCSANHASLINARGMQVRFGEELNRLLVVPLGRGPQGFNSDIAERDVLDVLDDVQASYAVDPDRVFAGGYSMGGYGALRFAALYPDRFAGGVNWVGFTGDVFNAPVVGHPFSGFSNSGGFSNSSVGAEGNMVDFIGNLRHVPMASLYSGGDELVTVNTGLAMMEAFRNAVDVPYRFFFHPAADHMTYALADDWRKEAAYLAGRTRVSNPARVTFRTDQSLDYPNYEINHDSAYWVSDIRRRGTSGYSDVDLVTSGCGASVPVFSTVPDAGANVPAGADPVPWVAEHRTQTGTQPLVQSHTLKGTLRNVGELTVDAGGACLGDAPTICIATDGATTLHFSDSRPSQTLTSCPQG